MTEVRLDTDQIEELKDLLENEYAELVLTYVRDTTEKVSTLQQVLESADAVASCEIAHSIKGASLNLGVMALSELCLEVEKAARNGDISVGQNLINDIKTLADYSCQALLATLDS